MAYDMQMKAALHIVLMWFVSVGADSAYCQKKEIELSEHPVDFVFERFGYLLGPSRTGWLSGDLKTYGPLLLRPSKSGKLQAGAGSPSRASMALYVSDSEVFTLGTYGYPHKGVRHNADEKPDAFAKKKLMTVPQERWLLVLFGKTNVREDLLYLNAPGIQMTAWTRDKERICYRPEDAAKLYQAMKATGIPDKKWYQVFQGYRNNLRHRPVSETVMAEVSAMMAEKPVLRAIFNNMISRDISMTDVSNYGGIAHAA